uniref:Retinol dehydrogenase 7-like n=1 Tax=Crassostrea virginica TaxID=6565 RepID=A0A8B8D1K3_CRAVI|nr:retinol dehydrogenase 7-like [Crassostrea virginica]
MRWNLLNESFQSIGLWGLVNNAGIQVLHAPLEFHSPETIQKCISVNLMGALEVTKAFLPLVRKSRGRLVYCGFTPFPCRAPYVITKVILEALARCLRREMYYVGVTCHIIQPGPFKTSIVDPGEMQFALQKSDATDSEVRAFYGQQWLDKLKATFPSIPNIQSEDRSPVTDAIGHALFSMMPRSVYRCNCHFFYSLSLLPEWLNDWYFGMPPPAGVTQS